MSSEYYHGPVRTGMLPVIKSQFHVGSTFEIAHFKNGKMEFKSVHVIAMYPHFLVTEDIKPIGKYYHRDCYRYADLATVYYIRPLLIPFLSSF